MLKIINFVFYYYYIVLFIKYQILNLNVITKNRKRRRTSGFLFETSSCTMRKLNVNTAMPRPLKPAPQAKRVAPPAVPEMHRHSGSSFGLSGYPSAEDGGFTQLRESPAALTMKDDINEYGMPSKSPTSVSPYITQSAFTFPISTREPLTHKAAVYYHQQLALQEDQGIDLTQSPGRDSPGSSSGSAGSGSRHSTASLDSGRASSYITGGGASTRGALSSPRCSVSSCSIGSVDRMSQRSDYDVITDWLVDLKFEEYAQLFISAGYDMATITRMTPEDLTAIGIKNPQHRELIKKHIDSLQVPDGLPNFVPGSIEEWLRLLRLEEYVQPLLDQNYKTVRDVTQVTWEDLEDIGIVKLGHQKKILLAIKRVKDIISGKWNLKCGTYQQDYQRLQTSTRVAWDDSHGMYTECSCINHENNDFVTIKIRQPRGKSLESLEDISERNTRTHLTFSHYSTDSYSYFPPQQPFNRGGIDPNAAGLPSYHMGNVTWRRSYDDGDITPTNEIGLDLNEGGGTLPRQRNNSGRGQIMESASFGGAPASEATVVAAAISPGNLVIPLEYNSPGNQILLANKRYGATCSPLTTKKQAPEPPRRQCSVRNSKANSLEAPVGAGGAAFCHATGKYLHYEQLAPSRNLQQYIPSNLQPIYANYNIQTHQTTAEVHCDKTHDSKSNSSIDSIDTIPFANENTGTIKQRLLNRQEISSSLSLSSSSSSSSTNTVANIAQSFHSLKSSGSLHEQSSLGGGANSSEHTPPSSTVPSPLAGNNSILGGGAGGGRVLPSSTSGNVGATAAIPSTVNKANSVNLEALYHHSGSGGPAGPGGGGVEQIEDASGPPITSHAQSGTAGGCQSSNPNDSANVLNDIGNMLANLTDELDAMLEEEKRVGINDSE